MILLDSSDSLQVLLAGAVATTQPVLYAAYADHGAGTFTPGSSSGATNGATAVDWIAAPASGIKRQAKYLSLYNADTANVTATVRVVDNATNRILLKITLATGERLEFLDGEGFRVLDAAGAEKVIATGNGDVVGPASSVDTRIATFSGTTGKLLQDGGKTISEVRIIEQNSQSAAYTAVLSDGGKHLLHPSADTTARTFTIPANSSVAYPIGTAITFVNQNAAGVMTIAITTDTMRLAGAGTTGSRSLAANGMATALKITSTEWIISGTGLT